MQRLDRNSVPAPACITPHDPARLYANLHGPQKTEIRTTLLTIQKERCAYCERRTGLANDDGHIEHFREQDVHPHLTTQWANLFWSCNEKHSCGNHKGTCKIVGGAGKCRAFDPANIIDPCAEDPDHFMVFISDGTINPREGLTDVENHRYEETMRVFNLAESSSLRKSRQDAVDPYIGILYSLRAAGPEIFRDYIASELARLDSRPFATAIRHFFQSNL